MTLVKRAAICVSSMVLALTAQQTAAAESPDGATESPLSATYEFVGGETETKAVEQAIDTAVEELNVFIRGLARRRLRDANLPASKLVISVGEKEATVDQSGRPPITAPIDAAPIEWKNPNNGNVLLVSSALPSNRTLEQRLKGDRGTSVLRYTLEEDRATLVLRTKITIDMLSKPFSFKTTYRRVPTSEATEAPSSEAARRQ